MQKRIKKSHLFEFYGIECEHCIEMEFLVDQLEKEINVPVRRFEVWYNDENVKLLQKFDKDEMCGGVPFFYNKKTRSWICGATTYPNLKAWALGKPHERFLPPPKNEPEYMQGLKGWLDKLRNEGMKRMKKRTITQTDK
nr:thioredoxin family protein [Cryptomonas paramecium]